MNELLNNVTLAVEEALKKEIPCFLCGSLLEIRTDKRGKPYFICDSCGIQTFIRRKTGIRLFKELQNKIQNNIKPSLEIISLIKQLEKLNKKKEEIKASQSFLNFNSNDTKDLKIEALEKEIQRIGIKIQKIQNDLGDKNV